MALRQSTSEKILEIDCIEAVRNVPGIVGKLSVTSLENSEDLLMGPFEGPFVFRDEQMLDADQIETYRILCRHYGHKSLYEVLREKKLNSRRPLLFGFTEILSDEILYFNLIESPFFENSSRIKELLRQLLFEVLREEGVNFIVTEKPFEADAATLEELSGLGFCRLEDLVPDRMAEFSVLGDYKSQAKNFWYIYFLNEGDRETYLRKDRVPHLPEDFGVENEAAEKLWSIERIMKNIRLLIKRRHHGFDFIGDGNTIAEVLQELNDYLPEEYRSNIPGLLEGDAWESFGPIFEDLRLKLKFIVQSIPLEQLEALEECFPED